MRARIRVVTGRDPQAELSSLRDWLAREDQLRGHVATEQPAVAPDEMGALVDVLSVAVGAGGAVTVLANSISVWLTQRHSDVTIEVTSENGRSVVVDAKRVRDAAGLVEQTLRGVEQGQD